MNSFAGAVNVASLAFRTDLMIRRLAGSTVEDRGEWLVVHTPANPTFWWGNFILSRGLLRPGDGRRWNALFAAEFPQATHRAFGIDGTAGEVGDPAELTALQVTEDVSTVLTATAVRKPPTPEASCRPLTGHEDWLQAARLRGACYNTANTDGLTLFQRRTLAEQRKLTEQGHGAWFGAFVERQMVSALGIVTDRSGLARYQSVETHPKHRRQGLASHLVYLASCYATDGLGAHTLAIVADPDYQAIRLYRSLGFADVEHQVKLQTP
jgi:ribosomal protein S18 acetylase RimI-like enzyme